LPGPLARGCKPRAAVTAATICMRSPSEVDAKEVRIIDRHGFDSTQNRDTNTPPN
jgi:hypothetical protein